MTEGTVVDASREFPAALVDSLHARYPVTALPRCW